MKMPHSITLRNVAIAALLSVGGHLAIGTALAQPAPAATTAQQPAGPRAERGGPPPEARRGEPGRPQFDRAAMEKRMAEHRAKREAEFKTRLQLTPQQEGAWTSFSAAMKPPAGAPGTPGATQRPSREDFAKLTTPQRLDRMQQMKAQRDAEMAKRADATRSFYAQLSPSQQKVFDLETVRGGQRGHGKGPHHGPHGGPRGGEHRPMHRG